MHASIICSVVLSAATFVSSRSSASYLTQSLLSSSYGRQSSSSVPSQCTSICDPVNDKENDMSFHPGPRPC
ncbi:uncharacterized protein F5147DRAFT_677770 [Suillus discolor]|uniref:Secreted protein n=1 Tax=Suillus discolor TaxID=1912936 RepID=A0A9P7JXB1_9AGAM|nr:uncharacterized protein F5147DRAFT_677770 [Suillus discolor]KAG2114745.1 hypothetical protein F5147DRAFT_677770 [Suillus discolor]